MAFWGINCSDCEKQIEKLNNNDKSMRFFIFEKLLDFNRC